MMSPFRCAGVGLAVMIALGAPPLLAHDSPEHAIERLTARMAKEGQTPALLYRRACEYRALGQLSRAAADLQRALELDPQLFPALGELTRVQLAQGQVQNARQTVERAASLALTPPQQAAVAMLHCEIALATGDRNRALAACERACKLHPGEVEWLLRRSQIHADLGQHAARIAGLQAACQQNASIVLAIELIEAHLDAGRCAEVLPQIETELADSRWQSSWLLRRARARRQLGDDSGAKADLRAAIEEINQRLNPAQPDVALLADRGLAFALLGQSQAAHADWEAARTHHADSWTLRRLTNELRLDARTAASREQQP